MEVCIQVGGLYSRWRFLFKIEVGIKDEGLYSLWRFVFNMEVCIQDLSLYSISRVFMQNYGLYIKVRIIIMIQIVFKLEIGHGSYFR